MAKVNYYIYQGKKSDSERVEIKMRFVSGTSLESGETEIIADIEGRKMRRRISVIKKH